MNFDLNNWKSEYESLLFDDVVPFWMKHGIDNEFGGIGNLLDDDANKTGDDKYIWSQGRALWTFSALCTRYPEHAECGKWRAFADHIFSYLCNNGRDDRGYWMYRLSPAGEIMELDTSIYVDGFVLIGMSEYYALTKNETAKEIALDTYKVIEERLAVPGSYGTAPYEIPEGMKTHGINMIFSYFFYNLGKSIGSTEICARGIVLGKEILDDFYIPEKKAILEFVTLDGDYSNTPMGRACVPGHAIEAMWFLMEIFGDAGEQKYLKRAAELVKPHIEMGWDHEFGGIKLALDIENISPPYWGKPDCKAWWVQSEALVATIAAWKITGDDELLEWHERVKEYAFNNYPAPAGEWRQWLDREGNPAASAALPVKDPFHLPRALMKLVSLLD